MTTKIIDMTGKVFGRLRVLALEAERSRDHYARYRCVCSCGVEIVAIGRRLRMGGIKSCGCLYRDSRRTAHRTHGESQSTEYQTWLDMTKRCRKDPLYVKRGIFVCSRWLGAEGFVNFLADMGRRPGGARGAPDATSIDRKDNDGPYSPKNCRWATPTMQSRNRRSTCSLTWRGETLPIATWAERTGIKSRVIHDRIQLGWSVEHALTLARYVHPKTHQRTS